MRRSRVFVDGDGAEDLARLILLRGVSAWRTWTFDPLDVGSTITVGGSGSCDWQIASPGLPPMFLAFTGESLLARGLGRDPRVRLNGAPLGEDWVALRHGDRLDFGAATLGVILGARLHRGRARVDGANQGAETRDRAPSRGSVLTRDDSSRTLPVLFREPTPGEGAAHPPARYAAIAFGLLLAYAFWLMLLDEF